ncbi:MAG: hypothetical protein ACP5NX_04235 [Candidatus Bilamarchaeaceae archaeon]
MKAKTVIGASFIIALLAFSGCLQMSALDCDKPGANPLFCPTALEINQDLSTIPQEFKCAAGGCLGMYCESTDAPYPFNLFYGAGLKGGSCTFKATPEIKYDQASNYQDILSVGLGDKEYIRHFMLGAGPDFSGFAYADQYCDNSLRLAVKWVAYDRYSGTYGKPLKGPAECLLEKDVIPAYMIYKKEPLEQGDVQIAKDIAEELNGAGPVIIGVGTDFSESDFDPSDTVGIEQSYEVIAAQINAISSACPDCMIAFSPRFEPAKLYPSAQAGGAPAPNPVNPVKNLFEKHPGVKSKVSLIGLGVDSRYLPCDYSQAYLWMLKYAGDIHFNREMGQKPSFIPYIYIDKGRPGSDGTCEWDAYQSSMFYGSFFDQFAPAYIYKMGGIGAALYSIDGSGPPFYCVDCSLYDTDPKTGVAKQSESFVKWFKTCQRYFSPSGDAVDPGGAMPLVFPKPDPASDKMTSNNCGLLFNPRMYTYNTHPLVEYDTSTPGVPATMVSVVEPDPNLFMCDNSDYDSDVLPFGKNLPITPIATSDVMCAAYYNDFRKFAAMQELDTNGLRAIAGIESIDFSQKPSDSKCSVSIVLSDSNCVRKGIAMEEVTDPSASSPPEPGLPAGERTCAPLSPSPDQSGNPRYTCAYGLMQVIERPWNYWYELDASGSCRRNPDGSCVLRQEFQSVYDADEQGYKWAMDCSYINELSAYSNPSNEIRSKYSGLLVLGKPNALEMLASERFNPFKASHGICLGSYKLRHYQDVAKNYLLSKGATIPVLYDNGKVNMSRVNFLSMFLASYGYEGESMSGYMDAYINQLQKSCTAGSNDKDCEPGQFGLECHQIQDPVEYIVNCQDPNPTNPQNSRGARFLRYYLAFSKCGDNYGGWPPKSLAKNICTYYCFDQCGRNPLVMDSTLASVPGNKCCDDPSIGIVMRASGYCSP